MARTLYSVALCAIALPAVAAWTVTADGAPSGCTHVITDGNWQIGVYRNSDDNWTLGKRSGLNGSGYVAGSGDLDLTGVAGDCGVIIKASNNGALERIAGLTSIIFPDSLETMYGNTVAGERVLPFEGTEQATAVAAAKELGLAGVKPIGKWTTGTSGTKHWVVEELPVKLSVSLR